MDMQPHLTSAEREDPLLFLSDHNRLEQLCDVNGDSDDMAGVVFLYRWFHRLKERGELETMLDNTGHVPRGYWQIVGLGYFLVFTIAFLIVAIVTIVVWIAW